MVLAARRQERLESIATAIRRTGGAALAVPTDVGKLSALQDLTRAALERFGKIDILFNNAGFGRLNWFEKLDPLRDIETQLQVNLGGLIQLTRCVLPHMIERRSGHIINMSSQAGLVATPTYSVYAASKFGIRGFTDALRREVRIWGIQVSAVYPSGVKTEFSKHTGARRKTGVTTPTALQLSPEQVAQAIMGLVAQPRRMLILPRAMRLAVVFSVIFPGLVDRVIERRFVIPERLSR